MSTIRICADRNVPLWTRNPTSYTVKVLNLYSRTLLNFTVSCWTYKKTLSISKGWFHIFRFCDFIISIKVLEDEKSEIKAYWEISFVLVCVKNDSHLLGMKKYICGHIHVCLFSLIIIIIILVIDISTAYSRKF
jgi:hypothetical protein